MLKKDNEVKWSKDAKKYFNSVKFALTTTPILIRPYYSIGFIIFSVSFEHTLAAVLMQKKDKIEQPI